MTHYADRNPWGREIVRETNSTARPSNTGWRIGAILAVVALVALIVLLNSQNRADEAQAVQKTAAAEGAIADETTQAAAGQTARQSAADVAEGASATAPA
jgi:hypothetical protein